MSKASTSPTKWWLGSEEGEDRHRDENDDNEAAAPYEMPVTVGLLVRPKAYSGGAAETFNFYS